MNVQRLNLTEGTDAILNVTLVHEEEVLVPGLIDNLQANLITGLGKRTALATLSGEDYIVVNLPWEEGRLPGLCSLELKGSINGLNWTSIGKGIIRYTSGTEAGSDDVTVVGDVYDVVMEAGYHYTDTPVIKVEATIDDGVGEPSVETSYIRKVLGLMFHNLKGNGIVSSETEESQEDGGVNTAKFTDSQGNETILRVRNGRKGDTGLPGGTGPQGATSVYDQTTQDFLTTLETTTGTSQTKTMTQKAITDELFDPISLPCTIVTGKSIRLSDGVAISNSNINSTGFIALIGGERKLKCSQAYTEGDVTASFAFYSSAAESGFISSVNHVSEISDIPAGATHFRMSIKKTASSATVIHYGVSKQALYNLLPAAGWADGVDASIEEIEQSVEDVAAEFDGFNFIMESVTRPSLTASAFYMTSTTWKAKQNDQNYGRILNYNSHKGKKMRLTPNSSGTLVYAFVRVSASGVVAEEAVPFCTGCSRQIIHSTTIVDIPTDEEGVYLYFAQKYSNTNVVPASIEVGDTLMNYLSSVDEQLGTLTSMSSTGLKGKTVAFIGDSITYGHEGTGGDTTKAYHAIFSALAGCTAINLGVNGATYAANGRNNNHRLIEKVTSVNLSSADMVVLFAGTNDFSYDRVAIGNLFEEETITSEGYVGTKKRVAPQNSESFAGAVHETILAVRNIIGEKPMLIMTPLNRGRYSSNPKRPISSECNLNGDYLIDFVNALKEIGRFYCIPVFDAGAVFNVDPTDKSGSGSAYFSDTLHPNIAGHARLGKLLYKFVANNLVF